MQTTSAGSESADIRDITTGDGELARRLRSSLSSDGDLCPDRVDTIVERTLTPRGLRFPGLVDVPLAVTGEDEKERRNDRARAFASTFEETEHTFWTDGSAYPGGVAAGAVVTYLVDQDMSDDDPLTAPRVEVERRGIVGNGLCERGREGEKGNKKRRRKKEKTYKDSRRSFIRYRCEGGLVAEAWTLRGGATSFDAELSALARAIELCAHQATPGTHFRVFTDSQAAMRRVIDDRAGPGQRDAIRSILGANRLRLGESTISIHWIPGHAGIAGNEIADQWAGDAAARELACRSRAPPRVTRPSSMDSVVSSSFMKSALRRRAVSSWRECIIRGGKGRRHYRIPGEGTTPRIPAALGKVRKSLASRFFQLASGHAMTAPFLRDKFGWVESDQCWWCRSGRQSREHLFKECRTWKDEIRELWKKVGEASSTDGTSEQSEERKRGRKRRKGFGFFSREGKVRPGNCTVGKLLCDPRFTEAVLDFLRDTQVGCIKKGVIVRGEEAVWRKCFL